MGDLPPTADGGAHGRGNTVEIHISRMTETDSSTAGKCDSAPQVRSSCRRCDTSELSDNESGRFGMTIMMRVSDRNHQVVQGQDFLGYVYGHIGRMCTQITVVSLRVQVAV